MDTSDRAKALLKQADDSELVFVEGHDDAILELAEVDGDQRVVYDPKAIIFELVRRMP